MTVEELNKVTRGMLHIYYIDDYYKATEDKELGIFIPYDKRKKDYRRFFNKEVISMVCNITDIPNTTMNQVIIKVFIGKG